MIVGFLCENCGQGAANTAGVLRMKYSDEINIVRVPCAGRVGAREILQAFNEGAEAVTVVGCCFGACHYSDSNLIALRRVRIVKKFLAEMGYSTHCVTMYTARAAEGDTVVGDFEDVVALKENPGEAPCPGGEE
ncbi:MAG: hydrogenase iron-sulfur subunit [Candidatus Thorarchaeota archaeon]